MCSCQNTFACPESAPTLFPELIFNILVFNISALKMFELLNAKNLF